MKATMKREGTQEDIHRLIERWLPDLTKLDLWGVDWNSALWWGMMRIFRYCRMHLRDETIAYDIAWWAISCHAEDEFIPMADCCGGDALRGVIDAYRHVMQGAQKGWRGRRAGIG